MSAGGNFVGALNYPYAYKIILLRVTMVSSQVRKGDFGTSWTKDFNYSPERNPTSISGNYVGREITMNKKSGFRADVYDSSAPGRALPL